MKTRPYIIKGLSQLSARSARNNKPPAMRVRKRKLNKESPFPAIIELFKLLYIVKGKGDSNGKPNK